MPSPTPAPLSPPPQQQPTSTSPTPNCTSASKTYEEYELAQQHYRSKSGLRRQLRQANRTQHGGYSPTSFKGVSEREGIIGKIEREVSIGSNVGSVGSGGGSGGGVSERESQESCFDGDVDVDVSQNQEQEQEDFEGNGGRGDEQHINQAMNTPVNTPVNALHYFDHHSHSHSHSHSTGNDNDNGQNQHTPDTNESENNGEPKSFILPFLMFVILTALVLGYAFVYTTNNDNSDNSMFGENNSVIGGSWKDVKYVGDFFEWLFHVDIDVDVTNAGVDTRGVLSNDNNIQSQMDISLASDGTMDEL